MLHVCSICCANKEELLQAVIDFNPKNRIRKYTGFSGYGGAGYVIADDITDLECMNSILSQMEKLKMPKDKNYKLIEEYKKEYKRRIDCFLKEMGL